MDPVAIGKLLSDLGGWGAFLVVAAAGAFGFVRGWIVPGRIYDREAARADAATLAAAKNADALDRLTDSIETIVELRLRAVRDA